MRSGIRYLSSEGITLESTVSRDRCVYLWQLKPVLVREKSVSSCVRKCKKTKFSSIWIKVVERENPSANLSGDIESQFQGVVKESS